ncbi:MAG: glycosyltransferase family 4 protein [Candidatus Acidiferrales bacterium]|jgi:glycosyltransferase involved in cell wall biosynthesis
MKVLFIAQPFPYPPNTGSRNLIFHWLEAASRAHDVHLLWIGDPAEGKDRIPELPGVGIDSITAIPARELSARIRRLATAVLMGIPPTSLIGMTPAARTEILRHVRTGGYDVVVLTENVVSGYAPILSAYAPTVLFKHSVQAVDTRDARHRYGMWHPRWMLEEWMVRRFEAKTCHAATVVCTVNAEDVADLTKRYHLARSPEIAPIGVDLSLFPRRDRDPGGHVIGFFGNISWGANLDAVNWFMGHILPRIWEKVPSAQFRIIGPGSEHVTLGRSEPRIVCHGPSHIPDAMSDAAIGIVPVISGTGVRLKFLEMLSLGVPVVTTSLGALGTGCIHEEHALIADDADSFAAAVVALLGDAGLRRRLTQAGQKLIQRHSWQSFYPRILDILEKAASTSCKGGVMIQTSATQGAS